MPQIIRQDATGTTVMDDAGNIFTMPPGVVPSSLPIAGDFGNAAPPPSGPADHIPGMLAQVNGAAPPPPMPPPKAAPPPVPGQIAPLPAPAAPTAPAAAPQQSAPDVHISAADARAQAKRESDPAYQAERGYQQALGEGIAATQAEGAAKGQASDAQAQILADRNKEMDRIQAQRDAQIQADQAQLADMNSKMTGAIKDYADTKIVGDRRTTGEKTWGAIAIALSGLGEALKHHGGENPALKIINDSIAEDVNSQIRERDEQKDRISIMGTQIDRMRQMTGDRTAAWNLQMAGANEKAARQVELAAQQYSSPESKAHADALAAQLRMQGAEHQSAAVQQATQNQRADRQFAEEVRAHKASEGLQSESMKQAHDDRIAEMKQQADLEAKRLEAEGNKAQADAVRKQADAVANRGALVFQASVDPNTKQVTKGWTQMTNADGKPWVAPETDEGKKMPGMIAAQAEYNRLANTIVESIKQHGGESGWLKSSDYQKRIADLEAAQIQLGKAYDIPVTTRTIDILKSAATADVDPTSFLHDASSALEESKANVNAATNTILHHAGGYTGADIIPQDPNDLPGAQMSEEDKIFHDALTRVPGGGYTTGKDADVIRSMPGAANTDSATVNAAYSGFDDAQYQLALNAEHTIKSPQAPAEAKQHARAALEQIAKTATSPGYRELAAAILDRIDNPPTAAPVKPTYK